MRTRIIPAVALILMAAMGPALAQQHGAGVFTEPAIELRSEDKSVTIPFELINNHLIIPVSVGGETFRVILDTGMPISAVLLYDTDRIEGLGLNFGSMQVGVAGAGGGDPVPARLATGETVDLGAVRMKNTTLLVMPPMPGMAMYHEGVIGAAVFDNFIVDIDYDNRKLQLHDTASFKPAKDAVAIPLSFHGPRRIPYVNLEVETEEGGTQDIEVVVDLGASHNLSLNTDSIDSYVSPDDTISSTLGHGVGGAVEGRVGRIAGFKLGSFALKDVVATFPIGEHQHPGGMDSRNGNLGSGILMRFNVTFDYANKRMLLEPNESFARPFEWDMSGMRLRSVADSLRIDELIDGSPAADAGLAIDDVVTHVNGRPVTSGNMFELREMMKRNGSKLTIRVTREGQPVEVELTLRRLV
jgi:hypothetical protein